MANMVIPNEGKQLWLNNALTQSPADTTLSIRLYSNNYTPVDGSTSGNFTVATFTGYANVSISFASFPASSIVSNVAKSIYPTPPTYTCTGGSAQDVYGWFAVGVTSGKVYAAQRFDNTRNMSPGTTETLDPFQFSLETFV